MYYVTDGVYSSFMDELLHCEKRQPVVVHSVSEKKNQLRYFLVSTYEKLAHYSGLLQEHQKGNEKYVSTVWGPTADSHDCILKDTLLPEIEIGNWLAWFNVGAYTINLSTRFNGFEPPKVYPVMKKSDW